MEINKEILKSYLRQLPIDSKLDFNATNIINKARKIVDDELRKSHLKYFCKHY